MRFLRLTAKIEIVVALAVFFVLASYARAQTSDRWEVFGGYSYTRYAVFSLYSGPWTTYSFNGWQASASAKIVPHVEIEADFAGGHSSSPQPSSGFDLRTYMGGVRYSAGTGKTRVYAHGLLGALYFANNYDTPSSTSFAFALGGGADYWFQRHFGARLCQVDYLYNTNSAAAQTAPPRKADLPRAILASRRGSSSALVINKIVGSLPHFPQRTLHFRHELQSSWQEVSITLL